MIPDMTVHMNEKPSPWVERFFPLITAGGSVLDLACGNGRHSLLLAEHGYRVEAVDRDAAAVAGITAREPRIAARAADLEGGPWPYHGSAFDGIVVTNYLFRPLLPMLLNALEVNGVLIYETFMVGNERFGKPSNPAFLLRTGRNCWTWCGAGSPWWPSSRARSNCRGRRWCSAFAPRAAWNRGCPDGRRRIPAGRIRPQFATGFRRLVARQASQARGHGIIAACHPPCIVSC
jgi:SAM-dependent methyltransferase